MKCVDELRSEGKYITIYDIQGYVKGGDIYNIKRLLDLGYSLKNAANYAWEHNKIDVLKLLFTNGIYMDLDQYRMYTDSREYQLFFKWILKNKPEFFHLLKPEQISQFACVKDAYELCVDIGITGNDELAIEHALRSCNMPLLQRFIKKGVPIKIDSYISVSKAFDAEFMSELLKYAQINDHDFEQLIHEYIGYGKHIKTLRVIKQIVKPHRIWRPIPDMNDMRKQIAEGLVIDPSSFYNCNAVLTEQLIALGVEPDKDTINGAFRVYDADKVKILHKHGIELPAIPDDILEHWAKDVSDYPENIRWNKGIVDCVKYLVSQGVACPAHVAVALYI